ncbi:MAG TPA: NAD(P)-dependent oxidoreductase [Desulfovibrio sp.]|uniref:NAD(P)-dependent oxidoreductase n=1 Tax=Desulfovibrio sp. TaxID=885 RepID=UPI002D28B8C4|nr:NAD(P)-dependent oxidoreductase [Desulfovibrio sp.]HZF62258.1 NAD(P)-dependent oxidoreductase [Desulfovibrio sp.]
MEFGFIGVGAMGGPLARNLIRAGKTVHVYNRSAEGRDKTLAAGTSGVPAMSMADMASCKVVFTCLALPEHLTEKALGSDGLYAHMQPGSVHVELSTIDSQTAVALAEAADRQGIAYIQCTLGKTPAHAERGEAPLFVGGDQQAIAGLAEVWPVLGVFNNVGTVEAACAVKLVSNLVGMANLAVLSEGLRIGEAAGVEKNLLLQLLGETGAHSFQLDARGKSMAQGEYDPPRFALDLALKDLRLGCGMAHGMNVDVPLLDLVFARFGRGAAAGLGKKDCAAVHEV